MDLSGLFKRYHAFMTAPTSPLPLAMFRLCLGVILVISAALLYPDITAWYSDEGVLPSALAFHRFGRGHFSLFWIFGSSPLVVKAVFVVHLIGAVCFAMGLFSRTSALVAFVTLVSFHHRNVYVMYGGDTLMRIMLFFMIFSRCGEALSLDRLRALAKGYAQPGRYALVSALPIRMMQLQVCILYFTSFLWKSTGELWESGNAVYVVHQLGEFSHFAWPQFLKTYWVSKVLTWYTLFVEGAFVFAIWFKQTRRLTLVALVLLHIGLEYTLSIELFQFVILASLIVFLRDDELQSFGRTLLRYPRLWLGGIRWQGSNRKPISCPTLPVGRNPLR